MTTVRADGVAVYVFRRRPAVELLQLRRTDGDAAYQGTWQTIYGGIEPGETAVQAACRELREETGLRAQDMFQIEHLESFYFMAHDCVTLMPVFGVEVAADDEPILNEEHDDWRWVLAAEADQRFMWRSQRQAIAVLLDQLQRGGAAHHRLRVPLSAP